ncbi:hypothetical protein [Candidatus Trichorickettsia mobilis]|uniref:hypothetical protein n=1 Tax=Candidatus Trichorickettsia mobilis TaxID=1346319 RepID=UPI00292F0039|nr:hypothetical protein [Candidatus Trichorickettsia mobilis]
MNDVIKRFWLWCNNSLDTTILTIAVIIVTPLYTISLWLNDTYWQKVTIVSIATLIVHHRLQSAPLWVMLHGTLIIIGFLLTFLALPIPWLFVLLCASMAAFTIHLTNWNSNLRTFGNFTFIPVLYLACELNQELVEERLQTALSFVPYMIYAILPVLFISIYNHYYSYNKKEKSLIWYMLQLQNKSMDYGKGISSIEPLIAITLAVSLSALLVETEGVAKGQWLIWSSASVITGEVATASKKLRDRSIGVVLGVPIGIIPIAIINAVA